VLSRILLLSCFVAAGDIRPAWSQPPAGPSSPQLKVFLDCEGCFQDFLRTELAFVDFIRDRTEAEVHVLVTTVDTGGGGVEYTVAFIGGASFENVNNTLRTVTTRGDPEDVIRRQLATTLRIGLLNYVARRGVPAGLDVSVRLGSEEQRPAVAGDRWNNWVFSVRGGAAFEGEESSRERQIGGGISADRITPDWKITIGSEFDQETEEFDLDEDDPVKVSRRERDFSWLIVKALGEHWSAGATGEIRSSTFDNTKLRIEAAPAIEFNYFPYSMYQRRQLRAQYAVGVAHQTYHEETLFEKFEETLPGHEFSVTYDQQERWGSVEGRVEWFQYLNDLSKNRLETSGDLSWRILRGLSISLEGSASRVRDQISLPRRGATPEEILLELRELRSGYEYDFSIGFTYSFGSIFSSIVNPRFGQ
jgi:hypothetical protein